jgi:hypothetical protein
MNFCLVESMGRWRILEGREEGRVLSLSEAIEVPAVSALLLQDDHQRVDLVIRPLPMAAVWHYPVRTVSRSEKGYEANYQGSALLFVWGGAEPVPRTPSILFEVRDPLAEPET